MGWRPFLGHQSEEDLLQNCRARMDRLVKRKIKNVLDVFEKDGVFAFNIEPTCYDYVSGKTCLLYTSPSPRDATLSRMPSSA